MKNISLLFSISIHSINPILLLCHFLMKIKIKLKHKKILDKHKTGEINVYTLIFLAYRSKKFTYKHLSAQRKPFGRVSFLALCRTNHVRLSALRIADKKRELALSPNTRHHQFRIILQCRFCRKSHLNTHLPTHTIALLHQNDFRPSKRYS